MHKVALVAMVFASLAPSISHALASQSNAKGFLQEVCSVSGQKLFIQVVTTQGQQLQMALDVKPDQQPASISHHMEHCPFCHAGVADVMLPAPHAEMIVRLEVVAHQLAQYSTLFVFSTTFISPPSQAPPTL
ncbi:MAG: DUF2946 domain-containing protein [Methylophilus sp.]|nr:DUF2946 domain-containing protein [Methylophilus sp.]